MPPRELKRRDAVAITGWGLVGPLGHSAWGTFSALLAGRTMADRVGGLPADIDPVNLVQTLGSVGVARGTSVDPVVDLAERAAREALFMAGVDPRQVDGVVIGASKAAVTAVLCAAWQHRPGGGPVVATGLPQVRDADLAVVLGPHGYLSHHLQKRLGIKPPLNVVAACASSLAAVHQARVGLLRRRDSGRPKRVLVITAEASLLALLIHSYRRLGVLPPLKPSQYRGRPLDVQRGGFMLAEMAAAVVLELTTQPRPGQIELADTAVACESYDLVRPAPGMPALARVAERLLANRQIDLLHPHATGTVAHDPVELAVVAPCLKGQATDVYACKGALGHGLGSAGLVSLVIACMCAQTGKRPAMPWLDEPIVQEGLSVSREAATGHRVVAQAVLAGGFGGHVAGAVLVKHQSP